MQEMYYQHYKCMDKACGADDKLLVYPSEAVPPAVNCWQCHEGINLDHSQMLKLGRGMRLDGPPRLRV